MCVRFVLVWLKTICRAFFDIGKINASIFVCQSMPLHCLPWCAVPFYLKMAIKCLAFHYVFVQCKCVLREKTDTGKSCWQRYWLACRTIKYKHMKNCSWMILIITLAARSHEEIQMTNVLTDISQNCNKFFFEIDIKKKPSIQDIKDLETKQWMTLMGFCSKLDSRWIKAEVHS